MGWMIVQLLAGLIVLVFVVRGFKRHQLFFGEVGLLYRSGHFIKQIEPGVTWRFDPLGITTLARVPVLPASLSPHQYDVISSDQFAFRVTVTPLYTITDARHFHENTPQAEPGLAAFMPGPEVRFTRVSPLMAESVMEVVSKRTLEEFLADPIGSLAPVGMALAEALPGAQLDKLAITSITLPPEVRKMFTEVERARREGLAGLERAKAEQASLRALANAARNMAGNPQLAQLRMLQIMESAKGAKTFVLGNPSDIAGTDTTAKD